jgi:hypothetical protein
MDIISALAVGPNNILWAGTSGGGLCKYANFKWSVFSTYNSDLQDNYISSVKFDNTGILWVSAGSPLTGDVGTGGLSYFKNSKWYNINRYNSGFPGVTATDLAFDKMNNAWIATDAGLAKFDGARWVVYLSSNSGLSGNSVISVSIDSKQGKWCTSVGLSEYIGGN